MAGVTDLINTAIQVEGVLNNRRALEIQRRNALTNRIALVQTMGQLLTSQTARDELARAGETEGLVGSTDLDVLLAGTAPQSGVVQRGLAQEGLQNLTPDQRAALANEAVAREATGVGNAQLAQEHLAQEFFNTDLTPDMQRALHQNFLTRTFTGLDVGGLAQAEALAGLTPEELEEGAGVGIGTRLSARDLLNAEVAKAGNELEWLDITSRNALQEELTREGWAHEWNMLLGRAALAAKGANDVNATAELQNLASFMRNLESNKNTMSKTEIDIHAAAIQASLTRLYEAGYDVPTNLFQGLTHEDILTSTLAPVRQWWQQRIRGTNR